MAPTRPAPTYFALIGDIVRSRHLSDRAGVQQTLQETLRALNRRLKRRGLVAPLKLTAGDEIQGLLGDPALTVEIVVRIGDELHPAPVAWGLGAGALSTELGTDVAALDGPCFHRAREAVTSAAREGTWLRLAGFASPHGEAVEALFRLMGGIRSRWKEAQLRYVRSARTNNQQEVARLHRVDESTVSKALNAARFRDVRAGEEAARALLDWLSRDARADGGESAGK